MKNDDMITFLEALLYSNEGESPSKAIENQERRGQQDLVKTQRLPKRVNDYGLPSEIMMAGIDNSMSFDTRFEIAKKNNIEYTKQQYEKMGIHIIDEADDLFWNVELPEGWHIEATDHHMWNDLFDNKGRKRAKVFYKAAFYDRKSFINFLTRFTVSVDHTADASVDYNVWEKSDYQGMIKDGDRVIFSTECISPADDYSEDNKITKRLKQQLEAYMLEHYPDYKNINAYWN